MNNTQFRSLLLEKTAAASTNNNGGAIATQRPNATPMLGSRARSSIPMTPRSVPGYNSSNDFARQVAEHKRELSGEPAKKRFKSSAAPKGSKLAQGYQDRARIRDTDEEDDKEKRLKALEEMLKLQQIDQATFDKLRDEIGVGGDVGSTHLVKGLDFKLLERVRRGEDIAAPKKEEPEQEAVPNARVEDELEQVLEKDVEAVQKEQKEKRGEMAPPPAKLSRDQLLQKLKEGRKAQPEPPLPAEPALGDRFKKVGTGDGSEKKRFTEVVDGRRREVLVTTGKDGRTKRKVRWLDKPGEGPEHPEIPETAQPMGMEVPAELAAKQEALLKQQQEAEDEDDDIFAGVGADYDPLADIDDDDASESDGEVKDIAPTVKADTRKEPVTRERPQSYFGTKDTKEDQDSTQPISTAPTILAAMKRAAKLNIPDAQVEHDEGEAEDDDPERLARRRQFVERLKKDERDDARDMDMGFGESRFGDEDDEDGPIFEDEGKKEKKAPRKRAPKKRKGDKDNVADVMGVLAGRESKKDKK